MDLTGASLTGADLTDAHLSGAYLSGADLTDATLTNVKSGGITGDGSTTLPTNWQYKLPDWSGCGPDRADLGLAALTGTPAA